MKKKRERKLVSFDEMLRIYGPRNKAARGEPSWVVLFCAGNGEVQNENFIVVKKDKMIERLCKFFYKKAIRQAIEESVKERVFGEVKIGNDRFLVIPSIVATVTSKK